MKRILSLFIATIICLAMCSCKKDAPYGSPLALYKNGDALIELGMSQETVQQILGEPTDKTNSFFSYDGLDLYFDNNELCVITCSNSIYTDYQGISTDKGSIDLTHLSDFLLGNKALRFDENKNELIVKSDPDKSFIEQESDVMYYIVYSMNKTNNTIISEMSIGTKNAILGVE